MGGETRSGHDLRRARTRAQLVSAARELIAETGVSGLRMAAIADRAGVALGSFYNHFGSRDELVAAVVETNLDTLAATAVEVRPGEDAAHVVSVATRRFVRLAYDDPEVARLAVNLNRDDARIVRVSAPYAREALRRGMDSGRFDIPDIEVSFAFIAGGALTLMHTILAGDRPLPGPDADVAFAQAALCSLGVRRRDARRISALPLPAVG